MTSSEDIISVSGLSKRFGKVEALSGLTLHAKPGIIGLFGPNGAGKTTLLRILLDLVKPDSGNASPCQIRCYGQVCFLGTAVA